MAVMDFLKNAASVTIYSGEADIAISRSDVGLQNHQTATPTMTNHFHWAKISSPKLVRLLNCCPILQALLLHLSAFDPRAYL